MHVSLGMEPHGTLIGNLEPSASKLLSWLVGQYFKTTTSEDQISGLDDPQRKPSLEFYF